MPSNSRFTIAVHILTVLARAGEDPLKSDFVAISINTNPVVVRRIWSSLAKAGLIVSRTGATGGGKLARAAADITLFDVYSAVENQRLFGFHAHPPNKKCVIGKNIQNALGCIFSEAQHEMEQVLARKTIADILDAVMQCQK